MRTSQPQSSPSRRAAVFALVLMPAVLLLAACGASTGGTSGGSIAAATATSTTAPTNTPVATLPPAPTCNSNFANSPIKGPQTSVDGVPLPPITFVVPDNAAGLRGYDLCSSGTVASITAFLNQSLPAAGWTKVASDPRCFYTDQCWTNASNAISWHVDDPTDWHIAYHPPMP